MILFLLKLSLCWGFFALLYTWLLGYETFFRANRAYLLGTLVLGIALASIPAGQVDDGAAPTVILPVFTLGFQQVEAVSKQWQSLDYLWFIYWVGFVFTTARFLWGMLKLLKMIRTGRHNCLADGTHLVHTPEARTPFSFFHWIFIPDAQEHTLTAPFYQAILSHERAHAEGGHSMDVLLAEILSIVFWFHPLAHWYKRSLRAVHEYLADAAASRYTDRKQYGLLLIGQSQFEMPVAFANHFFQSPLKQRLVMLTKANSSPLRASKFGLVVPVALLFALLFRQAPAVAQAVDHSKTSLPQHEVQASKSDNADPEFPGGPNAMMNFLASNIKYPATAKAANAEGMVVVSLVIAKDGSIKEVKQGETSPVNHPDLVAEAIRVVSMMPKWKPAVKEGKIVKAEICLPIRFKLSDQ